MRSVTFQPDGISFVGLVVSELLTYESWRAAWAAAAKKYITTGTKAHTAFEDTTSKKNNLGALP